MGPYYNWLALAASSISNKMPVYFCSLPTYLSNDLNLLASVGSILSESGRLLAPRLFYYLDCEIVPAAERVSTTIE